jgi:subtilisin family serine protease
MAAPHVAGLAALVRGLHPGWSNGAVASQIGNTADPMACPDDVSIYGFFPAVDNGAPQVCTGGRGSNGFYGKGQINVLTAVQ